jgi:D-sedoheptulose 7-phosphate isomerase
MNFDESIENHLETAVLYKKNCIGDVKKIAKVCLDALNTGHKIIICGNGGSAADSQHFAAELLGRFHKERVSLPAIALTTDTSILTSIANDYDYSKVFSRQIEGLGNKGDVLIGISTSGNSANVIAAFEKAKGKGIQTIAFTGIKESKASAMADITLKIPSSITARIQECHILTIHLICEYIDSHYGD